MTSVQSWQRHFQQMASNNLAPGTLHFVKNKGGGGKLYYKVQQPLISPVAQVVKQAKAQVSKRINMTTKKRKTSL